MPPVLLAKGKGVVRGRPFPSALRMRRIIISREIGKIHNGVHYAPGYCARVCVCVNIVCVR